MPEPLPPSQLPIVMLTYPHLLRLDGMVWTAWLQDNDYEIEECWYDLKVGERIAVDPRAPVATIRLAEGTGCKRIDVVFRAEGRLYVTEIKPLASHTALGQVLCYLDLFRQRYGEPWPLVGAVCCVEVDDDLRPLFAKHEVELLVTRGKPWSAPG